MKTIVIFCSAVTNLENFAGPKTFHKPVHHHREKPEMTGISQFASITTLQGELSFSNPQEKGIDDSFSELVCHYTGVS